MLCSGWLKPSRTCISARFPICRIRRCSARPLPSASPSGLRCDVIRKLLPPRIRAATSFAARSGVVVMPSVCPSSAATRHLLPASRGEGLRLGLARSMYPAHLVNQSLSVPRPTQCRASRRERAKRVEGLRAVRHSRLPLILLDVREQLLDAPCPRRRFVVAEFELGCDAQVDALAEEVTDAAALCAQLLHDLLRLVFLETADIHPRQAQVGADLDLGHGNHCQAVVFEVAPEDLDERVAEVFADA